MGELFEAFRVMVLLVCASYLYRRPGLGQPIGFVMLVGLAAYFATLGVLMGLPS